MSGSIYREVVPYFFNLTKAELCKFKSYLTMESPWKTLCLLLLSEKLFD